MKLSAINIVEKTMKKHPRHPHIRRLAIHLGSQGEMEIPESEVTGLIWADTMGGDWEKIGKPAIMSFAHLQSHLLYEKALLECKCMVCTQKDGRIYKFKEGMEKSRLV